MKHYLLLISIFSVLTVTAQEEYIIHIGDTSLRIALDKPYQVHLNGKKISFTVRSMDTITYNDELYSFQYLKDFNISKTKVDEGIEQIMLMTAEGSGVLIQKYSSFNPSRLNEMMLDEVTKESLSYGFTMKRQDYTATLKSGQKIEVNKAVLTYKDETNTYEVATIGNKDEGILIMTMVMDEDNSRQGKKLIDLLWRSLIYK